MKINEKKNYKSTYEMLTVALTMMILLIPSFLGVLEETEFYKMHIITGTCILFAFAFYINKKIKFLNNWLDLLLLMFPVLYLITILWAAYFCDAVEEALKYINYFLIYLFYAKLIDKKQINNITKIFYFVSVIIAIIGMLSYLDIIALVGAKNRIFSTLKYTNALAAYVGANFFLGLDYQIKENKKNIFSVCNFILLLTFFGTLSRIAWIMFPVGLLIFFALYPINRLQLLLNMFFSTVLPFSFSLLIFGNSSIQKLIWLLIGLIISFVLPNIAEKIVHKLNVLKIKSNYILAGFLLIFIGTLLVIPVFSESSIIKRILAINWQESSLQLRLFFYKDALNIIKDFPLGTGGGSWLALYPLYRSILYYSTDPHSILFKTGVELGMIGILLILALIVLLTYLLIKQRNDGNKVALGTGILFIYLHSFFDLDFTLGFISVVVWGLIGLFINGLEAINLKKQISFNKYTILPVVSILIIISSLCTISLNNFNMIKKVDMSYYNALDKIEKSIKYFPLDSKYYANLASIYSVGYKYNEDEKYVDLITKSIQKAIRYDRYNYNWYLSKARYLSDFAKPKEAAEVLIENKNYIFRFENEKFIDTTKILLEAAEQEYLNGKEKSGDVISQEIINLWQLAEDDMEKVSKQAIKYWQQSPVLTDDEELIKNVMKACFYINDKKKIDILQQQLADKEGNKKFISQINENIDMNVKDKIELLK